MSRTSGTTSSRVKASVPTVRLTGRSIACASPAGQQNGAELGRFADDARRLESGLRGHLAEVAHVDGRADPRRVGLAAGPTADGRCDPPAYADRPGAMRLRIGRQLEGGEAPAPQHAAHVPNVSERDRRIRHVPEDDMGYARVDARVGHWLE